MRQKELICLPLGNWQLTDDIYTYKLSKSLTDDGDAFYSIRLERDQYNHGERLSLFEVEEYYFENAYDRRKLGDHKIKRLQGLSGCGGLTIISDGIVGTFSSLKLIPRGSFKQYAKNEIK